MCVIQTQMWANVNKVLTRSLDTFMFVIVSAVRKCQDADTTYPTLVEFMAKTMSVNPKITKNYNKNLSGH